VRLHWCSSGLFARLPLHAATAGRKARCGESCSDYVVSSYTPTLSALLRARKDGDIVDIASNADVRALLIAASHSPGMPPLLGVLEEIQVVEESLNMQHNILGGDDASPSTKQAVMSRLPLSPVVHFACHGVQDTNPLQSGFCLADSRLCILDLMVLNLPHAFLAFLSACETAAVGADWTEEAIHLAGSLLFCGFRSVVATTW
jgi:CHAT domain-containing protein